MLDYENELSDLYKEKEWFLKQPTELSPLIGAWRVHQRIELRGRELVYQSDENALPVTTDQKTMRHEVLGGFLRLAEASDRDILVYAQQCGVMGICRHGLPIAHKIEPFHSHEIAGCKRRQKKEWFYESLDRWRYYSRQFGAIVRLAVELRRAKENLEERNAFDKFARANSSRTLGEVIWPDWLPHFLVNPADYSRPRKTSRTSSHIRMSSLVPGKREDWELVYQDFERRFGYIWGSGLEIGRAALSSVIDRWLGITGIRPYFRWHADSTEFTLSSWIRPSFLLPVLTVQLMLLLNGSPDYALCYSCHKPFFLRKGQNLSQKTYCEDCGTKAARREASKKYYHQERSNSDRKKRKRLTPGQVKAIQRALKHSRPGLVKELAEKYGVSEWAIYKIREGKTRSEQK